MVDTRKIYFNYDDKEREGFERFHPAHIVGLDAETFSEITGEGVLEKILDPIAFVENCYRILKPEGIATFTAPYYASWQAWNDPRNIRGICQGSLNFADKTWREQNNCPDLANCDFEVGCNFAIDLVATQRSEVAKEFWINRYTNIIQSIMFTLKKR